jgi:hypothetical protein
MTAGGGPGIVMQQQQHLLCPFPYMLLLDSAVKVNELRNECAA